MRVDQIMTTPVLYCRSNESLEQAAKKLWDHDCGALPIVNDEGHLVGMLTDRDICMAALINCKPLSEILIYIAMSKEVFAVSPDTDTVEVEQLMTERRIRRVPVVDAANKPIGIITLSDLVRAVQPGCKIAGEARGVMKALAEVCEPRSYNGRAA